MKSKKLFFIVMSILCPRIFPAALVDVLPVEQAFPGVLEIAITAEEDWCRFIAAADAMAPDLVINVGGDGGVLCKTMHDSNFLRVGGYQGSMAVSRVPYLEISYSGASFEARLQEKTAFLGRVSMVMQIILNSIQQVLLKGQGRICLRGSSTAISAVLTIFFTIHAMQAYGAMDKNAWRLICRVVRELMNSHQWAYRADMAALLFDAAFRDGKHVNNLLAVTAPCVCDALRGVLLRDEGDAASFEADSLPALMAGLAV